MEIQRELIDPEDEEYLQGIEKIHQGKNGARTPSASSVVRPKAPETEKNTVAM